MNINSLSLSGHLVKDFELIKGIAKSSIAINTWDKKTFYVDLIAFKNTAEYIIKAKFKKGELIVVSGELYVNSYNEKKYTQCIVNEINRFAKPKDDEIVVDDEPLIESGASLGQPTGDIDVSDDEPIDINDDSLPF